MRQITQMVLLFALATSQARAAAQPPFNPTAPAINWKSMGYDPAPTAPPATESREVATRSLLLAGFGWVATKALRIRRSLGPIPAES